MKSSLLFVWLFPLSIAHGSDFTVEKIQKAYEGIKGIKGSFLQKSHIKDLKRTEIYKGSFIIKMPSLMKWQYSGDKKQDTEVIISNDEIIIFKKSENQAYRGKFDRETYGQSPIALLSGLGNIETEFDVAANEGKLKLRPKRPMGNVDYIELKPPETNTGFPIGALSIIDKRSNRIDITISEITINPAIKDSVFDFSLPKGASMYDYSHGR
ncbi:MAG: outer-membrane lipoprotein carrier protein LolA [Nitrospirota bacterium]